MYLDTTINYLQEIFSFIECAVMNFRLRSQKETTAKFGPLWEKNLGPIEKETGT